MKPDDPKQVELYASPDGSTSLEVRTDGETVWLNRQQLAALFGRDVKTIGKHVSNAMKEELEGIPTVAKFATVATEGERQVERQVEHYNLDMILSVGYRVKSAEGVHFRRWATDALRRYVIDGAAINERRLNELGSIVRVLSRSTDQMVAGVADVIAGYLPGLQLLRDYDDGHLGEVRGRTPEWVLTLEEARAVIAHVRDDFESDALFGNERGDALAGVIGTIYQGFAGEDLYPGIEEKAANLLYLIVKDHPLSDGNKRSGAALFVTFLSRNGALEGSGGLVINNNALAAITLLVAISDPKEKDLMIALITRMIADGA